MLEALLKNLASWDGSVREKAIRQALLLPPDDLLYLLELEAKRYRREKNVFRLLKIGFPMASISCLWLSWVYWGTWLGLILNKLGAYCVSGIGITFLGNYLYPFYARRSIAVLLESVYDTRLIPFLLQMERELNSRQRESLTMIRAALTRLLPQLRRSEVDTWTKSQKRQLLRILERPERSIDLTVSTLRALEQVGDAEAIPAVADLQYSSILPVRKAARECLPYLQQRVSETRQAKVLLRASREEAPTGELLKPAMAQGETPGEQLLRAGIKEN